MIKTLFIFLLFATQLASAQQVDQDLMRIKKRMDSVKQFSASLILELDVPFIKMPTKTAKINYAVGKKMVFSSKDFVMLPKRGLDFSLSEIFRYPFITVDRGTEKRNGRSLKVINIIPTTNQSDLALATLYMDTKAVRIVQSEINTRKEGSYTLLMNYAQLKDILPNNVEATFAIEKLKIPLNFMGKGTTIDRKKMRSMETKTGKIKMQINDYLIKY
ncbi:hypothetical protein [Pedobacter hartonius]|uniref:Outer membrane lipoprotein-sorting protein n=1 Tax=Pedobacter hartonius TaxID=425514 RepID=A0A1H4DUX0_9SPHI|nr:hypothetical protein [Pedobacter hartonius]SEA76289.1 hypothetical protein SAMN05443550_105108 [Pedobacter hartonius]